MASTEKFTDKDGFVCPKCGDRRLEIVMTDAVVSQELDFNPHTKELLYIGDAEIHDACVDHFQCYHCGWVIPGATDEETLIKLLGGNAE